MLKDLRTLRLVALLILPLSIINACKSTKTVDDSAIESENAQDLKQIAEEKIGTPFLTSYNTDKSYALCQQQRSGNHLRAVIKFIVVKVPENTIAHEGSFQQGHVQWIDNESIEVVTIPDGNESNTRKEIVNIKAKRQ